MQKRLSILLSDDDDNVFRRILSKYNISKSDAVRRGINLLEDVMDETRKKTDGTRAGMLYIKKEDGSIVEFKVF